MSRHHIADAILVLERARERVKPEFAAPTDQAMRTLHDVIGALDDAMSSGRRSAPVVEDVTVIGRRMVQALLDAGRGVEAAIDEEVRPLRRLLWTAGPPAAASGLTGPAAALPSGGHLRDFAEPGEPRPTPGSRYEAAPLVMPEAIGLGIARQGKMNDCYFVAAVNAVAHRHPEALRRVVRQDPDDQNVVIVSVHGGTYRVPATLPVDEATGARVCATSADGSTMVSYLEKAAAAHFGSWGDLAVGLPVMVSWWLVGDLYQDHYSFHVEDMTDEDIRRVVSSSAPGMASVEAGDRTPAWSSAMTRLGLIEQHSYTIEGTTPDGRVRLRNPWCRLDPTEPLSVQDLRDVSVVLCWADDEPYEPSRAPEPEGADQ